MSVSRTDNNLSAALQSLQATKKDLQQMGSRTSVDSINTWRTLISAMANLAFAEGILFAETSLTGDDWRKLIEELES